MDKKLGIMQAATSFLCDWFNGKLIGTVAYAGNDIELQFTGYALYPTGEKGKVIIRLPSDYVTVSSITGDVKYRPLYQREVGFYQEKVGTAFVHPHIWDSGVPCWDSHQRKSIIDLFVYFLNTLLYTNVNAKSLRVGKPVPDSKMYNSDYSLILREVDKQKNRLVTVMNLSLNIFDTKYFNVKFARNIDTAVRLIMKSK